MESKLILFFSVALMMISCVPAKSQLENPRNIPYRWETDTTKKSVSLSEFTVVVPKAAFKVLVNPRFVTTGEGSKMYAKHEPVISVALNGQSKAYPLSILIQHEIANDTLGGVPVLITYCPLCNSSIVYSRNLTHQKKEQLHFEVSGMLRNSDMVMYDTETETWWQQLTGEALVGALVGSRLLVIPSLILTFDEFSRRYPNGQILSMKTDAAAGTYGTNPYAGYDNLENFPFDEFFDKTKVDKRLPAMERVVDVESDGKHKIYPFSSLSKQSVINDSFNGKNIVIFFTSTTLSTLNEREISHSRKAGSAVLFNAVLDGQRLTFEKKGNHFKDLQTKSYWDVTGRSFDGPLKGKQLRLEPHSNHFAFAWLSFYPDSEIYLK